MSEIVNIKPGKLVGIHTSLYTIFNAEKYDAAVIPGAWQEFFVKAANTELANGQIFYGASIPSMSFDVPMDYFAGANIAGSYAKAYMEVLPTSGSEMRPAPHLEIYNSERDPSSEDYSMLIGVPVN